MATEAERKAAFEAANERLFALVRKLAPSFIEPRAEQEIREHEDDVQGIVDAALDAAERARAGS